MSSGKKGKKGDKKDKKEKSFKTVGLNEFLASSENKLSWADDVEDDHSSYGYSSKPKPDLVYSLPTAPRSARDVEFDEENVPTKPPFAIRISNLPFDSNQEDLTAFFQDLKITSIELPSDGTKLRGFGVVEFEDRQGLIEALKMSNMPIKNRKVKIEVSNNSNDDRRGRMRDNRRDDYDPDRTSGDWRSGPREELPYNGSDRYRPRGYANRRDDREREGTSDRSTSWRGSGPRENTDRERPAESGEIRTRQKLELKPRTKPIEAIVVKEDEKKEEEEKKKEVPKPKPTPVPSAQIFGNAKPVDTAAKEREIEERLSKSKEESDADRDSHDKREPYRVMDRVIDSRSRRIEKYHFHTKDNRDDRDLDNRDDRDRDNRDDRDRRKPKGWRTEDDRGEYQSFSKGPQIRSSVPPTRSSSRPNESRSFERERKLDRDDEIARMPKAKDDESPNFVTLSSNKYSMLSDDVEPDNDIE